MNTKYTIALLLLFFSFQSYATIHTITNSGTTFTPDYILITEGDTVVFNLDPSHNAQEVSSTTWNNNSNSPIIGFQTAFGGGMVTGLTAGIHYYVCDPHASLGMKGRIEVQAAATPSIEFILTSYTVGESVGSFNAFISITNPNSSPTSVDINVLPASTAQYNFDFTFSPITVTFPANSSTNQFITVNIVNDNSFEPTEFFILRLANPTNNATIGANSDLQVNILDNDSLRIGFANSSLTVNEGDGTAFVSVSLGQSSTLNTSVNVQLQSTGTTATSGSDFIFSDTTITWTAGTSGAIFVPIDLTDDATAEPDEYVRLILTNPTNSAALSGDTFLLTITDNEVPNPATVRFISQNTTVSEDVDSVAVIFEVNNPSSNQVTFNVAIDGNQSTASNVADYIYTNQNIVINGAGIFTDTLYVKIVDEQLIETDEIIYMRFINASNNVAIGSDSTYIITIQDNDQLSVSFLGAGFSYIEADTVAQVRVVLSSPVPDTTTVSVSLAPGSATIGTDFLFTDTTIIFPPNSIDTQAFYVTVIDDNIQETNEQINFNLTNATNGALLGISAYTFTIIDNDTEVGIADIINEGKFTVYPNPTSSRLFIKTNEDVKNVSIISLQGQLIKTLSRGNTVNTFETDISDLTPGMYLVRIETPSGFAFKRIVKAE